MVRKSGSYARVQFILLQPMPCGNIIGDNTADNHKQLAGPLQRIAWLRQQHFRDVEPTDHRVLEPVDQDERKYSPAEEQDTQNGHRVRQDQGKEGRGHRASIGKPGCAIQTGCGSLGS